MKKSLAYIVDKLQEKLGRTDLLDFVENLIDKDIDYQRLGSIENLGNYLSCDYDELENSYNKLIDAKNDGHGESFAYEFVEVQLNFELFSVNEILELIWEN